MAFAIHRRYGGGGGVRRQACIIIIIIIIIIIGTPYLPTSFGIEPPPENPIPLAT
jgi:hypothetical protein